MSLPDLPAFASGNTAAITGGASGIGLACAQLFANGGMKVALIDRDEEALADARTSLEGATCETFVCDVSNADAVADVASQITASLGPVSALMNNAGAGMNPGKPWENADGWRQLLDINFGGILNGVQAFLPAMLDAGSPGVVINTGSKQGITLPPGNSAYNVSKAAVKAYTEMLAHELRGIEDCQVTAHLLIPGFVYTGMVRKFLPEKPPGAWTPEQTAEFMFESLARGDFYILCPDNDVTRAMDEKRSAWSAGDLIENRPPLSRWHPDFADAFEAYMKG